MEQRNMKQQRKKYAITSALLSLVLILTGTFAWTSISQRATNIATVEANPGGRIHDDYNIQAVMNGTGTTANKDIYAENFGQTDLIVRIKLSEFLSIDGVAKTGTDPLLKSTWVPYVLGNTVAARSYVTWKMGQLETKDFLPTFNLTTDPLTDPLTALATDASGDAIDDLAGTWTAPGDGNHSFFTSGTYYDSSGAVDPLAAATSHEAKSTLTQTSNVMSMSAWITAGRPIGNFWVVDVDGWAYWAKRLAPGQATSLLLDELTFTISEEGVFYYAIDVMGEFVTASDIDEFSDASLDAEILLASVVRGIYIPTTERETFIDHETGVVWRVLVPNDGSGNALIITEHVYNVGQQYNTSGLWTLYEDSDLKTGMDAWYGTNVGTTLKAQSLDYAYQTLAGALEPAGNKGLAGTGTGVEFTGPQAIFDATRNDTKAKTVADATSTPGNGNVFALSVSEVNHYASAAAGSALNRQTTDIAGTDLGWWLRSPGILNTYPLSYVYTNGGVTFGPATMPDRGFRAALWVRR